MCVCVCVSVCVCVCVCVRMRARACVCVYFACMWVSACVNPYMCNSNNFSKFSHWETWNDEFKKE